MIWNNSQYLLTVALVLVAANGFSPPSYATYRQTGLIRFNRLNLENSNKNDYGDTTITTTVEQKTCWNPPLRKIITGLSSIGAIETAYLTYSKVQGNSVVCPIDGSSSCQDVLNGPYSVLPIVANHDIPLAAIGCLIYTLTAGIAVSPLLVKDPEDTLNRYALVALTTSLATVSTFLLLLLGTVLHTFCPYCVLSIGLSYTVAASTYFGQALADQSSHLSTVASSVVASSMASLLLYGGIASRDGISSSSVALATDTADNAPPAITTMSTSQAVEVAKMLRQSNAKMYGAFWCSHCYDQKQTLGLPAFQSVQYIECSRDGYQSQADLCRERNIPGYPTWEVDGKLYPGEQSLEELQQIVSDVKQSK
jgi:uncharacterized membrane protein